MGNFRGWVAGAGYERSVQWCLSTFPNNTCLDFPFERLICALKSTSSFQIQASILESLDVLMSSWVCYWAYINLSNVNTCLQAPILILHLRKCVINPFKCNYVLTGTYIIFYISDKEYIISDPFLYNDSHYLLFQSS